MKPDSKMPNSERGVRFPVSDSALRTPHSAFCCLGSLLLGAALVAHDQPAESKRPSEKKNVASTSEDKPAQSEQGAKTAARRVRKKPLPLELRPYRVLVLVTFAPDPASTPAFRRRVLARIRKVTARTFGQMWRLQVEENRRLLPAGREGLGRLTPATMQKEFDEAEIDKVYVLAIESAGPRYSLAGREWDTKSRNLSLLETGRTYQRRTVGPAAFSLVQRLFRPLVNVETAQDNAIQLKVQAGDFPPVDPGAAQITPGDLLQPFFRYRDRKRVVQRIQFIPLTYILVDNSNRANVSGTVVSGLRSALGRKSRRRVDQMAIRVRPKWGGTRLKFVRRRNRTKPLIGHEVTVYFKTFIKEEAKGEPLQLLTDRTGSVSVGFNPEQPIVWLYVRSGTALLARIPYVPGIEPAATVELPDDSLRLKVEGDIAILQGRMVDTVAKRAVHMMRALSFARKEEWDKVHPLLAEIEKLPGIAVYESQLTAIRVPAIEAAQAQRNRSAESKIRKLCSNAQQLIRRYLDSEKLRQVQEEIDELRHLEQ